MKKINFSVVLITKNEANTLPRAMESLTEFRSRGGEVVVVDTGSTDRTVEIALSYGAVVYEKKDDFLLTIDSELSKKINKKFVVNGESPVVIAGQKLFDFSSARNFAASMAKNDMVCTLDGDEVYSKLDIDAIIDLVEGGYNQFEYQFVFAHDHSGRPTIQFVQSKMYDRRKMEWKGIVHECLFLKNEPTKRLLLAENIIKLEHWQEQGKSHRANYLPGLALDCYLNPDNDRNSHYFGRELLWTKRPWSAIKELKRHVSMQAWDTERAQSLTFIGDAYGLLLNEPEQEKYYFESFSLEGRRREPLLKLAALYQQQGSATKTAAFAEAALSLPYFDYYANNRQDYEEMPHSFLYWAYGWQGRIDKAQEHIKKALLYSPFNQKILDDTKYYFEYPANKINGWMTFEELQFLYEHAKLMDTICEVGSWMGRSTHALLSGCKGEVTAVDTWLGSNGEEHIHGKYTKDDAVYKEFCDNMKEFRHLKIARGDSLTFAEKDVQIYDMVFIDASHQYEDVLKDIRAYRNKAKILLCGHDYCPAWPGVQRAVDEELGGPDGIAGSIWYKWIEKPKVSIIIPTLGREEKLNVLLKSIKDNAGYDNYEVLVEADQFPPKNLGVPKMVKKLTKKAKGDLIMYLGNDCIMQENCVRNAVISMLKYYPGKDGLIGLNDGYWRHGEMATHWLAGKRLLPILGGEFFHIGYYHTGCDNELTELSRNAGKYFWDETAKIYHDHPIQKGFKESDLDDVYRFAYRDDRRAHDLLLLKQRAEEKGFKVYENFVDPDLLIPKHIYTVWVGGEMPEMVRKCIASQKIAGYKHTIINEQSIHLDIYLKNHKFLQGALKTKKWAKVADFLRLYFLKEGGIYLDADIEVLKPFTDEILVNDLFACREENGFISNAIIGVKKNHYLVKKMLDWYDTLSEEEGANDKVFEYGMEKWTEITDIDKNVKIYPNEYFMPYNHQTGVTNITENTYTIHYFLQSWV